MRYTFRQLEYFIAAGETGSITCAAERIRISQPSVSTAIAHLEKELGVQLFVRHHEGLTLTSSGRGLLRHAKSLMAQAEGLYSQARESSGSVRGPLSISCLVTLAPMLLPELSQAFSNAYPEIRLRQRVGDQECVIADLRRGEVDVVLSYDLGLTDDLAFTPLASLPPHVVVGESHRLARRSSISLQELADEPMILLDLPLSRDYFTGLFQQERVTPRILERVPHFELVQTMVANGYGYSIFNARPRSEHAMDGRSIVRVPLNGCPAPLNVGTMTSRIAVRTRVVDAFERHCALRVSDACIPGMVAPVLDRSAAAARDETRESVGVE